MLYELNMADNMNSVLTLMNQIEHFGSIGGECYEPSAMCTTLRAYTAEHVAHHLAYEQNRSVLNFGIGDNSDLNLRVALHVPMNRHF